MLLGVYNEELEKQAIREEAEARGEARGRKEERAKAVKALIDIALDFGYSNEEILTTLQKKLGIKEQQADEYLRKFYDKTL